MPISFITFITSLLISILPIHYTSVLATHISTQHTSATSASTQIPSTITSSPTQQPISQTVDCLGPDNKHIYISQQACIKFNQAWKNPNYVIPTSPYGHATKIADHSYIINVRTDNRMATPQEIIDALNRYRTLKGSPALTINSSLTVFAQQRANYYTAQNKLDQHVGFIDYVTNQNGYQKLGFNNLGENASLIGPLLADHLIQWVFASDPEHDTNQLKPTWTNIGVGVSGRAVDIIFGGQRR